MNPILTGDTLLWIFVSLNAGLTVAFALFRSKSADHRAITTLRRQMTSLEENLGDLSERFSRKQSRDGMRAAREAKAVEKTLQEQAQQILAENTTGGSVRAVPAGDRKTELRRKLTGS